MEIKKIYLFPFKSLKGIEVNESTIDEHGFQHDRIYMLARKLENGKWGSVTQRSDPSMARIRQEIVGPNLQLSYEGGPTVELPLDVSKIPDSSPELEMELWGFPMVVRDVSDAKLRAFFADFLKQPKYTADSLAVVVSDRRRKVPERDYTKDFLAAREKPATSSFQDIWPGSLMTTASYEDVESHVESMNNAVPIDKNSFRMNLLIDTDEAWVEDDWRLVKIGGHEWQVDGPCERCPMPAVDQDLGEFRKARMPLPALNNYRVLEKGKTPCFGVNMINRDWGYKIHVGDRLEVITSE